MELVIDLTQKPKLILKQNKKIIDALAWDGLYQLEETLLDNIDKLLKRNRITLKELKKIKVEPSKKSMVSTRIAKAVALGLSVR